MAKRKRTKAQTMFYKTLHKQCSTKHYTNNVLQNITQKTFYKTLHKKRFTKHYTTNVLQNITQKTKDQATRTPLKSVDDV